MPSRNATQLAGFAEQGYLLLEDLLPDEAFGPLIADIEEGIERGARESLEEGRIRQTFDGESFIRRFASIEKEVGGGSKAGRHVLGKNLKTAGMFGLMTHPVLLDLVESMIGPEILSHPQFNCQAKMPGEEISKHHWHQDLAYLDAEAEETPMVNVWIPLVDATKKNGCLEVIPASHKTGLKPHGRLSAVGKRDIADEDLPGGRVVACPVRRGGRHRFSSQIRAPISSEPVPRDSLERRHPVFRFGDAEWTRGGTGVSCPQHEAPRRSRQQSLGLAKADGKLGVDSGSR